MTSDINGTVNGIQGNPVAEETLGVGGTNSLTVENDTPYNYLNINQI